MESLDSIISLIAANWWIGLIVVALFLGVRGNIPIWLGIAFSAAVLLVCAPYSLPYGLASAIQSLLHSFLNLFR